MHAVLAAVARWQHAECDHIKTYEVIDKFKAFRLPLPAPDDAIWTAFADANPRAFEARVHVRAASRKSEAATERVAVRVGAPNGFWVLPSVILSRCKESVTTWRCGWWGCERVSSSRCDCVRRSVPGQPRRPDRERSPEPQRYAGDRGIDAYGIDKEVRKAELPVFGVALPGEDWDDFSLADGHLRAINWGKHNKWVPAPDGGPSLPEDVYNTVVEGVPAVFGDPELPVHCPTYAEASRVVCARCRSPPGRLCGEPLPAQAHGPRAGTNLSFYVQCLTCTDPECKRTPKLYPEHIPDPVGDPASAGVAAGDGVGGGEAQGPFLLLFRRGEYLRTEAWLQWLKLDLFRMSCSLESAADAFDQHVQWSKDMDGTAPPFDLREFRQLRYVFLCAVYAAADIRRLLSCCSCCRLRGSIVADAKVQRITARVAGLCGRGPHPVVPVCATALHTPVASGPCVREPFRVALPVQTLGSYV